MAFAGVGTGSPGNLVAMLAADAVYNSDPAWNAQRAAGKTSFVKSAAWRQVFAEALELKKANCFASDAVTVQIPAAEGQFAGGPSSDVHGSGPGYRVPAVL